MNLSRVIKALLVISLTLYLCACSKQEPPIRLGITPWPGYGYFYIANELGFFQEQGVNVKLVDFLSLADSRRAFELGYIDAWCTTPVELLMTRQYSSKKPVAIWVTNTSAGSDVVLARTSIKTTADLKGKRIGIEPATVDVIVLAAALKESGLTLDDVTIIPISHNAMFKSLENNEVDAVTVYPPESVTIESEPAYARVFDSAQMEDTIIDVLAVDKSTLKIRNKDLEAIIRAYKRAELYVKENPNVAKKMLSKFVGISMEDLDREMEGVKMVSSGDQAYFIGKNGVMPRALEEIKAALSDGGVSIRGTLNDELFSSDYFNVRE